MAESTIGERMAHQWYLRPVLVVSDLQAALRFYIEKLGFKKKWHIDNVCQVDRGGCEIILCEDPARQDKGRLFVELGSGTTRRGALALADNLLRSRPRSI